MIKYVYFEYTAKEIPVNAFYAWKGDLNQIDDVCMIGLRK